MRWTGCARRRAPLPPLPAVIEPVFCDMDNKEVERMADNDDAPLVSSKERSSTPPDEGSPKDRSPSPEAPEVVCVSVCLCVCVCACVGVGTYVGVLLLIVGFVYGIVGIHAFALLHSPALHLIPCGCFCVSNWYNHLWPNIRTVEG